MRSALAVAFLSLMVLSACGGGPALDPALVAEGREIYSFEGCAGCHGVQRQGSTAAPPLDGARRYWSEDELTRYLADPASYPKDARLARLEQRYPAAMAGLPGASEERLRVLTAFLLSR